jgi:hypothetical protein
MNTRNHLILAIRGEQLGEVMAETLSEEIFQNKILRPILKFQNGLLLDVLRNYIQKHNKNYDGLAVEKKISFIESAIQKDIKLRNSLKGFVLGLFTQEEYQEYIKNSSQLNKRMMNLVLERYISQVQII